MHVIPTDVLIYVTVPDDVEDEDLDEATMELLQADYQIGHFIRERVIPHAVLYFTGEACDVSTYDNFTYTGVYLCV